MAVALNNLGILNFAFGKWEEAVNHLEQADRLRSEYGNDPERPINLKNLGEVLVALGDYARARVKMETSRSISERLGMDLAKTYAELGLCHLALKEENFTLAQSHLSNASQLIESSDQESDRACIFYTLKAMVEAQLGNLSQALEAAQKALQIAERSAEAQLELARAESKMRVDFNASYGIASRKPEHLFDALWVGGDCRQAARGVDGEGQAVDEARKRHSAVAPAAGRDQREVRTRSAST